MPTTLSVLVKMQSGDFAGAEKEFLSAAQLDPKSATPHRYLGELYSSNAKRDQATQELGTALQLDPKDWRPTRHLD